MFLAFKEMQRSKVRFGLLIAAVGLLVFLILFQQALQSALLKAFTGAIENQSAPILVYSTDGQRVLQGSIIVPAQEAVIRSVPGVGDAGRIGVGTFTVAAPSDLVDATLIGYEKEALGAPTTLESGRLPSAPNEVVASADQGQSGFDVGDVVTVVPGDLQLTVVGVATEAQLNASPTLFGSFDTYEAAIAARNPDAGEVLPNVIGLAPAPGVSVDELVERVNATDLAFDALTREDAAANTPGVQQVRQSFQVIFLLYALVVPLVTGLFFLIVTFQKANTLTLLRAIGAPSARLVQALVVQVLVVIGGGLVVGIAGYALISTMSVGSLSLTFDSMPVVVWSALLLSLGVLSSLVAAKRVLSIDPVAATTGAGVGR